MANRYADDIVDLSDCATPGKRARGEIVGGHSALGREQTVAQGLRGERNDPTTRNVTNVVVTEDKARELQERLKRRATDEAKLA